MKKFIPLILLPLLAISCFNFTVTRHEESGGGEVSTPDEETMRVDHVVDHVEVLILESFPPQLELVVMGYQPDGCDYPMEIEQRREGNDVYVEIYRAMPVDVMCPQVIKDFSANIRIDGNFEVGQTYTIHVNDFTQDVTL